jgi:hypothetical protein
MTPSRPSYTTDALYAVGRNVVNFQRLEHLLKRLALAAPISAPVSALKSVIETRKVKTERLTFGSAVKKWIESTNHATNQQPAPDSDSEITISFGFEFTRSPEDLDQLSDELESLAQERNALIHLNLAQVNFDNEAECIALCNQLNAQNDRMTRPIEILGSILTGLDKLTGWIASEEGQREITGHVRSSRKKV